MIHLSIMESTAQRAQCCEVIVKPSLVPVNVSQRRGLICYGGGGKQERVDDKFLVCLAFISPSGLLRATHDIEIPNDFIDYRRNSFLLVPEEQTPFLF